MAMRNKEVMHILEKLDYIKELQERHPYLTIFMGRFLSISDDLSNKYKELALKDLSEFKETLEKAIDQEKSRLYRSDWCEQIEASGDDMMIIDNSQMNMYLYGDPDIEDDKTKLCEDYLRIMIGELQKVLVHKYQIYPDGYVTNYQGADEAYLHEVNNKKYDDVGTIYYDRMNVSTQRSFRVLQELNKDDKTYAINHIVPNFTRKVNDEAILLTLNLSLPIEEIADYISQIKKTMDESDERIVKLSEELKEKEFEAGSNIINMSAVNSRGTRITFESRWGSQLQKKFADMFFIYDAVKAGMKKAAILSSLDKAHDPDNKRKDSFHSDTYSKYLLIATEYIENKKYLELITGVKPKNFSS